MARPRIVLADDQAMPLEAFEALLQPAFAELIRFAVRHVVAAS